MKVQSSVRARLCGVAVLMAVVAGCGGGGGGGSDPGPSAPPPGPPAGPPAGPPPAAEVRGWIKPLGSASVVLGQTGFDQRDSGGGAVSPIRTPLGRSAVTPDGRLFVVSNGAVKVFRDYESMNGPSAESEFSVIASGIPATAVDLSTQDSKLVATSTDGMVFIYNAAPADSVEADATAGLSGFQECTASLLDGPRSAFLTPGGRLVVADTRNNRVLIWNNAQAGALGDADVVLGQETMITCAANDDDGDGDSDGGPSKRTLSEPHSVWSDGTKLVVADTGNNRLLVWDDFENVASFQDADHVVGQQNFVDAASNGGQAAPSATTLSQPLSVHVSTAGELAVADAGNNRVLVWSAIPGSDGQPAQFVVGQGDFLHAAPDDPGQTGLPGTSPSAKTLRFAEGAIFHGRNLIVNDTSNDRVLVWRESD